MDNIGTRIKQMRDYLNLSRAEFAPMIGISTAALYNYESGERVPNADLINKICEITKTLPAWLLTGKGLQRLEDLELLISPIIVDLLDACELSLSRNLTENEKILLTHKFRNILAVRIMELFNDNYTTVRKIDNKNLINKSNNVDMKIYGSEHIINNSNDNVIGNNNIKISGNLDGGINITTKTKKENTNILPAQGTIGASPLLVERITGLFNELGLRRKERFGKSAFSVMYKEFKKDFSIPKNQKYLAYKLWPETRGQEIIDYLEQKLGKTIQGIKEKNFEKKGHTMPFLLGETTRLHKMLGWSENDYRERLHHLFGVTSRVDLNQSQLANYVEYLRDQIDKL